MMLSYKTNTIDIKQSALYLPNLEQQTSQAGIFTPSASSTLKVTHRNPETVSVYLTRYPEIEDFIQSACPVLVQYFGEPVELILEVITYSDETAHEELVGWIQSTDNVVEGLAKFEHFEEEWFLHHLDTVYDKFNFNIEIK